MRINPNSSIRSGYAFEDLFLMKIFFDWLKNPKLYKRIKIQHAPDEVNKAKFYLDDIVAEDRKGRYHLFQLKHKQNPQTDFWTFPSLLDKEGKKESLLEKWVRSIIALPLQKSIGFFVTTGLPNAEIQTCLLKDRIQPNTLKEKYPVEYQKLLQLFNTENELEAFCSIFSFQFGFPDKNVFELQLRNNFYNELKVTKAGFDNLLIEISKEGSEKYPNEFTLQAIKKMLQWYNPRPLRQDFEIPQDFELHDNVKHETLIADLQNAAGGIKVIVGKPGVGKSTYLSMLHETIEKELKTFSVRHHYHLNPNDSSFYERLNAQRAIEAIKAEFQKLPEKALGEFANISLQHIPLHEIISVVAKYHVSIGKTFILIIDGLDHVIRERGSKKELLDLLREVLYPQRGLWIILGTQRLAVEHFETAIRKYAPKNTWVEIRGLKKVSVEKIVLKNLSELSKIRGNYRSDLVDLIYSSTEGNALHLRYILTQLKTKGHQLTVKDIQSIPAYKGDIADYYSALWNELQPISKTFALAIVLFDCKINEKDIYELGAFLTKQPTKITESLNQIQHLLRIDISGVTAYHNSFLVFINNQPELEQQRLSLYKKTRAWLKETKNDYLKWLLLPQVEYHLGNYSLLLDINREWVVHNYLQCRNENDIIYLLELATEAAFKSHEYSKVLLFRIFSASIENREYNLHEAISKIWSLAFKLRAKDNLYSPDIDHLDGYQIKAYLIALNDKGILLSIPNEIRARFNELLKEDNNNEDIPLLWIELLFTFHRENSIRPVCQFILQYKDEYGSGRYFGFFLTLLLKAGYINETQLLLKQEFTLDQKEQLTEAIAKFNLDHNTAYCSEFIISCPKKVLGFNALVYLLLRQPQSFPLDFLPDASDFPYELTHNPEQSNRTQNLYINTFLTGISLTMADKEQEILNWRSTQADRWAITAMSLLLEASQSIGQRIKAKEKLEYNFVVESLNSLRMLDYRDDYKIYDLRRIIIPNCLTLVLQLCVHHNKMIGSDYLYNADNITKLKTCKWFYNSTVSNHLATFSSPPITKEALKQFVDLETNEIEKDIEPFRDKAEVLINAAQIAYSGNSITSAKQLLSRAAQYIISHGYHKDTYLYALMQGIEICADASSTKTLKYIKEVAPYIHEVGNFTDGDETGSFIHNLADLYGKFNKQWLFKLYFKAAKEQDYYKAEAFFSDIISILNPASLLNQAVLGTAIDKHSFKVLEYRATKEKEIKKIFRDIQNIFGEVEYLDDYNNSTHKYKKVRKPQYLKVLPEKIAAHLTALKTKGFESNDYVKKQYLNEWLQCWLAKRPDKRLQVFSYVKEIIIKDLSETSEEVLKLIYPIALELDREFAFDCLTWSHANGSIWGPTWSKRLNESKAMWGIAVQDFPERIDEYFEKSIERSGYYYGKGGHYFMPIPKAISFFVDCNDLRQAEEILEAAISHVTELTPGIAIPALGYLHDKQLVDEFDVLLMRLVWINPMVIERAAYGLAQLLIKDKDGAYHQRLAQWIAKQQLESIVVYPLLAILKSLESKKSQTYAFLNADKLLNSIMVTSTTLYVLLNLIYEKLSMEFPHFDYVTDFDLTITDMPELEKFKQTIGFQIQRVYMDICDRIEQETRFKVYNLWALLFEEKKRAINLIESHTVDDYCNDKREYMMARTTIVSELLKSSFIKVLDYLYHKGYITSGDLFFQVFRLVPIDLSIWKIDLSPKPQWWPTFQDGPTEGKIELSNLALPITDIVKPLNNWQVIHLDGAILPSSGDFYESRLSGNIHLLPFAYKIAGNRIPDKKAIYKFLEKFGGYYPDGFDYNNFSIFDNEITFSGDAPYCVKIDDVLIYPLVSNVHSLSGNVWQYYRLYGHLKIPTPLAITNLQLEIKSGQLQLIDDDGNARYISKDFLAGIKDRAPYKSNTPYGRYLLADTAFLESLLSKYGLRLAYVYRTDFQIKTSRYAEESETATFYELINFSSVIL